MRNNYLAAVICVVLVPVAAGKMLAQEHPPEHVWDYGEAHGPSHWGELKPEFAPCANGHHQSPIDIRNPQKADLPPIQFDYKPSSLDIIDNGHTVMVTYAPGSSISVGGKVYALKQFHFHRPSEEKINGKGFEMVAHLVHAGSEAEEPLGRGATGLALRARSRRPEGPRAGAGLVQEVGKPRRHLLGTSGTAARPGNTEALACRT